MKCASLNCEFLLVFSLDCFLLKRVHPACAHSPLGSRKHAVAAGHSIRSRGGQPILDEDSCKSLKEHMLPLEKRGDCLTLTEFDALVVVKMKEQAYQRGINPATVRPPHEDTVRHLRARLGIHKRAHPAVQTERRKDVCF